MDLGSGMSGKRCRQTVRDVREWLDRHFDLEGVAESGLEQLVLDAILDACVPVSVSQHWLWIRWIS